MFWYFLGLIIGGIIWGWATQKVIENKGYYDNWFWWGFFFGFIALIVALTKPEVRSSYVRSGESIDASLAKLKVAAAAEQQHRIAAANAQLKQETLAAGGWECFCGKANAHYISTCSCGRNKREVLAKIDTLKPKPTTPPPAETKPQPEAPKAATATTENDKIAALKGYKELLDAGILTQEEFDAKKKELLGL